MSMDNGGEKAIGMNLPFRVEIMKPLSESTAGILTVMHIIGVMDAISAVAETLREQGMETDPQVLEEAQKQALNMLWGITDKIEEARQAVRAI